MKNGNPFWVAVFSGQWSERRDRIISFHNSGKVLIELFQKFAEYEAEPHFNAKASAFATVLQNDEALLRHFGQSQSFPNVGKDCALSPFSQIKLSPKTKFRLAFSHILRYN
ncbi:MAG: hypothetical protein IKK01_02685 [Clostridia bacterium]|nr:hypothetical protein [Clostridia bacterium]